MEVLEAQVGLALPIPNDFHTQITFAQDFLKLRAPLLRVCDVMSDHTQSILYILLDERGEQIVRFVADLERTEKYAKMEIFCLPITMIEHRTAFEKKEEIQGLALTLSEKAVGEFPRIFERVGFFTTYQMNKCKVTNKRLFEAEVETIYIV